MRRRPSVVFALVVFAAVIGLWMWRVQHAVDMSDESYYIALPLRFALGDRPFYDERGSQQGAGLLLAPLVLAYHLVVRDNAGIVLFMRVAFIAYLAGLGIATARAVRGWISPAAAIACAAIACFFVPYAITQFSYNTVGAGLAMLAGVASLRVARARDAKEAGRSAILSGAAVAAAALAYPTLAVLVPVHLVTLLLFGRAHLSPLRIVARYAIGGVAVGLLVGAYLLRSGLGSLALTVDFVRAWGPTLTNPTSKLWEGLDGIKTNWLPTLVVAGVLAAAASRFRPLVVVLAAAIPFLAAPTFPVDVCDSMRFFSCAAVFAPIVATLIADRKTAFRVLAIVWAPGLLTAFMAGISSSNLYNACGLGGFASMMAGCVLACRACEEASGRHRFLAPAFGLVPPLALLFVLSLRVLAPTSVYRDAPPRTMTAKVRKGPFSGLYTTAVRRDVVERMHDDIVANAHGRFVLFLPDMPSGYLSANLRPAIPELWPSGVPGRSAIDARIFRERLAETDLVVVRRCESTRNWQTWTDCTPDLDNPNDPLQAAVLETHGELRRTPDYSLRIRR